MPVEPSYYQLSSWLPPALRLMICTVLHQYEIVLVPCDFTVQLTAPVTMQFQVEQLVLQNYEHPHQHQLHFVSKS